MFVSADCYVTISVLRQPNSGLGRFTVEVSRSHTYTPGRVPLNEWSSCRWGFYLHKEQHTQQTNIHACIGIWTLDRNNRVAASHRTATVIDLCDIFRNLQSKTCSMSTPLSTNGSVSVFIYKWFVSIANSNGSPLKRPFVFGKTFPALFDTTLRLRKRRGLHFYSAKGLRESEDFRSLTHYIFTFISTFCCFSEARNNTVANYIVLSVLTCLYADIRLEHYYCKYLLMSKQAEIICIQH